MNCNLKLNNMFGLTEKQIWEVINSYPIPPGEDPETYKQALYDNLKKFSDLDLFGNIEEVLDIAANWARKMPQTEKQIREGVLAERERRLDSYTRNITEQKG